jgi:hypothetical protein
MPLLGGRLQIARALDTMIPAEVLPFSTPRRISRFGFQGSPTWVSKVEVPTEKGRKGEIFKGTPEEVAKMKDYTMPDGQKEQVKIAPGKRQPTSEVSLITAELGTLGDGRKALSMITMFPGGTKVDGTEIPMNRGEFAAKGLYFVVDPSSPLLKEDILETVDKVLKKYRNKNKF